MTWKVVDSVTFKSYDVSLVRPANDSAHPNRRLEPINGPVAPVVVPAFAKNPNLHSLDSTKDVPIILRAAPDDTDGESSRFADTFEKLVVSIKDADGNVQVDALGNPLKATAPNPLELQGKSILTLSLIHI